MSNIFEAFVAGLKGINAKQTESETEAKVGYAVVSTAAAPADSNLSKLPFALAITALVLSLTFLFSLSGAVLGIVAAAILYLLKKNGIQASYSRATAIIAACALLLGACCACSYAVASAYRPADMPDSTPLASTYQPEAEPETTIEEATFTLEIAAPSTKSSSDSDSSISKSSANSNSSASSSASSAPSKPSVPETVAVNISGTTEDGLTVSGTKSCTPGQAYELDLAPGKYILSFDDIAMPDGETFYKAASTTCTFTGEDSTAAYLELILDTEKADQVKAEKEAAEAARQAEAARAQAAAAAAANECTVYIANTGSKYHRSGCQYLKKSQNAISLSSAKAQGYTPCSRCNP